MDTMRLAEEVIAKSEKLPDGRRALEVIRSIGHHWTIRQLVPVINASGEIVAGEFVYEIILDNVSEEEARELLLDMKDILDEIEASAQPTATEEELRPLTIADLNPAIFSDYEEPVQEFEPPIVQEQPEPEEEEPKEAKTKKAK